MELWSRMQDSMLGMFSGKRAASASKDEPPAADDAGEDAPKT
jgi:hypothetical protein